jgi:hypothetical protein
MSLTLVRVTASRDSLDHCVTRSVAFDECLIRMRGESSGLTRPPCCGFVLPCALTTPRVSDLGPGDLVIVECLACDHSESLTALMLKTAGLPPHAVIRDLERRMRCRECDARGKVSISIRWAE